MPRASQPAQRFTKQRACRWLSPSTPETLSKSLGVAALAEGLETAEQAENFRRQGVALAQGYYFGAPMPMAQLLERVQGPAQS